VTSVNEDAESTEGNDSQLGQVDHQSPQPEVSDDKDTASEVLQVVPTQYRPVSTSTTTTLTDSSPNVDMHAACVPSPAARSEDDGGHLADSWRPTVGESPPPLPSPPQVAAEVTVVDDDATASLVITDVAKYVSNIQRFDRNLDKMLLNFEKKLTK